MFGGVSETKRTHTQVEGVPQKRTQAHKGGRGPKIDEIERTYGRTYEWPLSNSFDDKSYRLIYN